MRGFTTSLFGRCRCHDLCSGLGPGHRIPWQACGLGRNRCRGILAVHRLDRLADSCRNRSRSDRWVGGLGGIGLWRSGRLRRRWWCPIVGNHRKRGSLICGGHGSRYLLNRSSPARIDRRDRRRDGFDRFLGFLITNTGRNDHIFLPRLAGAVELLVDHGVGRINGVLVLRSDVDDIGEVFAERPDIDGRIDAHQKLELALVQEGRGIDNALRQVRAQM